MDWYERHKDTDVNARTCKQGMSDLILEALHWIAMLSDVDEDVARVIVQQGGDAAFDALFWRALADTTTWPLSLLTARGRCAWGVDDPVWTGCMGCARVWRVGANAPLVECLCSLALATSGLQGLTDVQAGRQALARLVQPAVPSTDAMAMSDVPLGLLNEPQQLRVYAAGRSIGGQATTACLRVDGAPRRVVGHRPAVGLWHGIDLRALLVPRPHRRAGGPRHARGALAHVAAVGDVLAKACGDGGLGPGVSGRGRGAPRRRGRPVGAVGGHRDGRQGALTAHRSMSRHRWTHTHTMFILVVGACNASHVSVDRRRRQRRP